MYKIGTKSWYKYNFPYIEESCDVIIFWYEAYKQNFKIHFHNEIPHRIDGPATEWDDGIKFWWYEGQRIFVNSQEEFEREIRLKLFW